MNCKSVVIMNFTGAYDEENFANNSNYTHINCTHLSGTDCYCDADGESNLRHIIAPYPADGIHFIDSGDYHYITKFWTDKLTRPFSLVLFDHHTDMQPPRWQGLLSCGGWVKSMLDTNPNLHKVWLMGIPESQVGTISPEYAGRVRVFTDQRLHNHSVLNLPLGLSEPIYISIDKDVLSPKSAITNWDQGILSLDDLQRVLRMLFLHEEIIGMDICGECSPQSEAYDAVGAALDDRANQAILDLLVP